MKLKKILTRSISVVNHSMIWAADRFSRQHVLKYLRFYSEAQWWSRKELEDFQNQKLRELLFTVEQDTPFYRELYKRNNVIPGKINSINDLVSLPIVRKKDFKIHRAGMYTRETGLPVKTYFTSGSSGTPFGVPVDSLSMSQARALMILRANYAGWNIGNPAFQTGMSLKRGVTKRLKDLFFKIYYASAYDLGDKKLDHYLEMIEKRKLKFLMGYPGSIYALSERAKKVGFYMHMKGIVTWGDNLYSHFRKSIESQFHCRVTDTYGCGEGIQVAAQCPNGDGNYHIFMPHVIVEIVNDDGTPVDRGQTGNILLTKLEPGAMPLIRYMIGDVGRMARDSMCKCGRGFDSLDAIDGRVSDFIYTPSGNRLIVHFFTGILEYYTEIDEFQVVQKQLNKITLNIVPNTRFRQSKLDEIRNEILDKGDKDLTVEFNIVSKIETPLTGKRKFVISEIENQNV